MARRTLALVAVLGLLTLAACHRAGARAKFSAVVDTVNGVPRTTWPGNGGPTLAWTLDTVAVIGTVMGTDPHYMLGMISGSGVAGDARGDVFVLDLDAHHVVSYDSTGSYLATYGRQGSGPGELGQVYGLAVGPGDTVWVQGISTHRLTGFPIQGGDARTIVLPAKHWLTPPLVAMRGMFLSEGFPIPSISMARQPDSADVVPLVSISEDGSRMDTLWSMPAVKPDLVQTKTDRGMTVYFSTPEFEPTLQWAVFSDGSIAVASDASYTIHLLAPDGRERMRIVRDLPPRPVTDHDREVARARVRANEPSGSTPNAKAARQMTEKHIKAMTFAPTVPRITGLRVDDSDRLWVGVSLLQPDSTERIDVFQRDGHLLGSIRGMKLPATFFASDLAATIRKDPQTDVQQVVVLRLREGAR